MYQEQYTHYHNQVLFQISRLQKSSTLMVFFHGIGDSHLNFSCFFNEPALLKYDLFVADLLGHGRSSACENCNFSAQTDALFAQLSPLLAHYQHIIFVPHSMGGIHATLLAANQCVDKISGIFAIETSITQYGSFIAKQVTELIANNLSFTDWLQHFKEKIYGQQNAPDNIFQTYYVGLRLVREPTFLANALEMYALATALKHQPFSHAIGKTFASLPIPKVYCLGNKGNQLPSIPFLQENNIDISYFPTSHHWVAQACLPAFCEQLDEFAKQCVLSR